MALPPARAGGMRTGYRGPACALLRGLLVSIALCAPASALSPPPSPPPPSPPESWLVYYNFWSPTTDTTYLGVDGVGGGHSCLTACEANPSCGGVSLCTNRACQCYHLFSNITAGQPGGLPTAAQIGSWRTPITITEASALPQKWGLFTRITISPPSPPMPPSPPPTPPRVPTVGFRRDGGSAVATLVITLAGDGGTSGDVDGTGTAARFNTLEYGALTSDGTTLYLADTGNHRIRKMDVHTRAVSTLCGGVGSGTADGAATAARFDYPRGMALTSTGTNLYVAEKSRVRKVDTSTGGVTTVAGGTSGGYADGVGAAARFNQLRGAALTSDGSYLYVVDGVNRRIRTVATATGVVTTLAGSGAQGGQDGLGVSATFFDVYTPVLTPDEQRLYVTDLCTTNFHAAHTSCENFGELTGAHVTRRSYAPLLCATAMRRRYAPPLRAAATRAAAVHPMRWFLARSVGAA